MRFFVDTADVDVIKRINSWGVLAGVTTNPTLIARQGRDFHETIKQIAAIVDGPVNAEVVATDHRGMMEEALTLSALADNVVVKIPMTEEGLRAVSSCRERGIATNVTLIFSANQALLAARAGAAYVSPFIGRLDDRGHDGMEVVRAAVEIFERGGIKTEVLAASIRHPRHVTAAARVGAHVATLPGDVFDKMLQHPLTDIGLERFLSDWRQAQEE